MRLTFPGLVNVLFAKIPWNVFPCLFNGLYVFGLALLLLASWDIRLMFPARVDELPGFIPWNVPPYLFILAVVFVIESIFIDVPAVFFVSLQVMAGEIVG